MFRAAIFTLATLTATTALSSPVATWSSAGSNPCDGRCDIEWAETYLTEQELKELTAYRELNSEPYTIFVDDGAVFTLMTYYKDGPIAYRTTTIADLQFPETATGWIVGDWAWIQLYACDNWAILDRTSVIPTNVVYPIDRVRTGDLFNPRFNNSSYFGGFTGGRFIGGGSSSVVERETIVEKEIIIIVKPEIPCVICPEKPGRPEKPIDPEFPHVIPLPAAAWFLITGVLALFGVKHLFRKNAATA